MKITLESKNCIFREWTSDDLSDLEMIFTNPLVVKHLFADGIPMTKEDLAPILSYFTNHYKKYGFGPWAVLDKTTNQFIGLSGLKRVPELENVDLGFAFIPEVWGRGIATETSQAIIDYGFNQLGEKKIGAHCSPENLISKNVLKKVGMRFQKNFERRGLPNELYVIEK
jgi:ribosomal-protein-alanine N-acetyltransferase